MTHPKSFKQVIHFENIAPRTETTAQPISIDRKVCVLCQKRKEEKFAMPSEFQKDRPWCRIQIPCREFAVFQ